VGGTSDSIADLAAADVEESPARPKATKLRRRLAAFFHLIVRRRNHRGWWVYLLFAIVYAFIALWFMADAMAATEWSDIVSAWPLFIPLALVVVQWIRPTILVWALISLPGLLYPLAGLAWAVFVNPNEIEMGNLVMGTAFLLVVMGMALAIAWATFPKPLAAAGGA